MEEAIHYNTRINPEITSQVPTHRDISKNLLVKTFSNTCNLASGNCTAEIMEGPDKGKWTTVNTKDLINPAAILYKGFIIQPSLSPFGGFDCFHIDQGMDVGTVRRSDTIEEAKDLISEKIMTLAPSWKVETFNPLTGNSNYTKFDWIVDAVKFASSVPGNLLGIENI